MAEEQRESTVRINDVVETSEEQKPIETDATEAVAETEVTPIEQNAPKVEVKTEKVGKTSIISHKGYVSSTALLGDQTKQDDLDDDDDYEDDGEGENEGEDEGEQEGEEEEEEEEAEEEEELHPSIILPPAPKGPTRYEQCETLVGKAKERHELVDEYLRLKAELRYEEKKNAYLQDRIYRTSVRKGIIDETKLRKDEGNNNAKKSDAIRMLLRKKLLQMRILKRKYKRAMKKIQKRRKKKAQKKSKNKSKKRRHRRHHRSKRHGKSSKSKHQKVSTQLKEHKKCKKGLEPKLSETESLVTDSIISINKARKDTVSADAKDKGYRQSHASKSNSVAGPRKHKHRHHRSTSKTKHHHTKTDKSSRPKKEHKRTKHKTSDKDATKGQKYETLSVSKNVPKSIKVKHLKRINTVKSSVSKATQKSSKSTELEFEKAKPTFYIKGRGVLGERINNEFKYDRLIHAVIAHLRKERKYAFYHENNLKRQACKRDLWKKAHEQKLQEILKIIKTYSDEAVDSNTGYRIPHSNTEQFCKDIAIIHAKLCSTMVSMFKSRRGLDLSLQRLEASEVQGEGLQMLEYEQLRSENQTLKDRLGDRIKDVENIKEKITHAIQVLAHFRNKMFSMNQQIADGKTLLSKVNTEVYAAREKTDRMVRRHEKVKKEEQSLVVESGLLDNADLLRDYETTHFKVMGLKEEKRKLSLELENYLHEIEDIKSRINEMKSQYPEVFVHEMELAIYKAEQNKKKQKRFRCQY